MKYLHGEQIVETWGKMGLEAQLGNIGSEYERALRWKAKKQPEYFQNAVNRMLELFDLTIADKRWRGPKLREICRAREVACAEIYDDPSYGKNPESLKKYFLQFAALARTGK